MADAWRRVGLIVNPVAGLGADESLRVARTAIERCGAREVSTGPGELGAAALTGWTGRVETPGDIAFPAPRRTRALARWMVGRPLDAVIVVGGDGTLSDAALEIANTIPIVGIGTGSTNVGRLVTCRAGQVPSLDVDELETWNVDALLASVNDEVVGLGFNDVVIGTTIVGTLDGRRCDLSATDRARGESVPATPRSIGGPTTKVTRIGRGTATLVAQGESVGTVVAGFAEPAFFGKAVTGGVCLASLAGMVAACLVSDVPLARVGMTADVLETAAPIRSAYVSLAEEVGIVVEGVEDGAVLCVDGNPTQILCLSDHVGIVARKGAVVGVRARQRVRSV